MLPARRPAMAPHGMASRPPSLRMSRETAITIGNFDGVHRGHQALVAAARSCVGPQGSVIAVTFHPHPVAVLRPGEAPWRLLTLHGRIDALRRAGADEVDVLDATATFLATDARRFIEQLHQRHRFQFVVEGRNFRFGRNRAGSMATLAALGKELGFEVRPVDPVRVVLRDGSEVIASSTLTRWLLELGRVEDAAVVLGRPHAVEGRVVRGDRRGRELGFPTANLDHGDLMLPADGIYAARAIRPDGGARPAAVSIGRKPTFGHGDRACEAHILDFHGEPEEYGWLLRLEFVAWLRGQFRYSSIEALRAQMGRDVRETARLAGSLMEARA